MPNLPIYNPSQVEPIALNYADASGNAQPVSAANPLPVAVVSGGGGSGASMPTGAAGTPNAAVVSVQGITGGTAMPVSMAGAGLTDLNTIAAAYGAVGSAAPASGEVFGIIDGGGNLRALGAAIFHNADNQTLGAAQYGIITGGVAQLLNAAGNLDRAREGYADGMASTGLAGGIGMLFNGATYDRNRSATGDGMASTGVQAAADLIWNGTGFDRPRSATAAQGTAGTGIVGEAAMGQFNTTPPVLATGQFGVAQLDASGNQLVNLKTALPAGTNTIGTVLGPLPAAPVVGQQTSTTSAAALPANALQNGVVITALAANTGTITVGGAGVTGSTGYPLTAGQSISFAVANTSGIFIIGTNATASAGGVLTSGTTYYYKITCVEIDNIESAASTEVSAAPSASNLSVTLAWTLPVSTPVKIRIYRGTATGGETFLEEIAGTATGFVDNGYRATAPGATPPATAQYYIAPDNRLRNGESSNMSGTQSNVSNATGVVAGTTGPAFGYGPRPLLIGDDLATPSVLGIGDSIMGYVGIFQDQGYIAGNGKQDGNWFNRGLTAAAINHVNCGLPGVQIGQVLSAAYSCRVRMALWKYAMNIHCQLGINDIWSGMSWTTLASNQLILAQMAVNAGKRFTLQTILPRTGSTDGWLTVANQSTNATYEPVRQNYNAWLRNGCQMSAGVPVLSGGTPSPLVYAVFDMAALFEVNAANAPTVGGSFWKVPGAATLTGTFAAGSTTTALVTSGLTAYASAGKMLAITSGVASGQKALIQTNSATAITAYASGVASETGAGNTVTGLATAPASGDSFAIWDAPSPDGVHPALVNHIAAATPFGAFGAANWQAG